MTDYIIDLSKFDISDRNLYTIYEPLNNAILLPVKITSKCTSGMFIVKSFGYSCFSNFSFLRILSKDGNDLIAINTMSGNSIIYPMEIANELYPELNDLHIYDEVSAINWSRVKKGVEIQFSVNKVFNSMFEVYYKKLKTPSLPTFKGQQKILENLRFNVIKDIEENSLLYLILNINTKLFITLDFISRFNPKDKPVLENPFTYMLSPQSFSESIGAAGYLKSINSQLKTQEETLINYSQLNIDIFCNSRGNRYMKEYQTLTEMLKLIVETIWEYYSTNLEEKEISEKLDLLFQAKELQELDKKYGKDFRNKNHPYMGNYNLSMLHEQITKKYPTKFSSSTLQVTPEEAIEEPLQAVPQWINTQQPIPTNEHWVHQQILLNPLT